MVAAQDTDQTYSTPIPENLAMENVTKTINKRMRRKHNKWTLIITFASLVLIIILITIAFLVAKGILSERNKDSHSTGALTDACEEESTCSIQLVETIPNVLVYPDPSPRHTETADAWKKLMTMANSSINIISFYWTLTSEDTKPGSHFPQAKVGEEILAGLRAAADRGVQIQIAQTIPSKQFPNKDTEALATHPRIDVRSVNMKSLIGAGIVHTKVWIIDEMHMYVGSANFDWRSLTEVKELGATFHNCKCAVQDLNKIFQINWLMGVKGAEIPDKWPASVQTSINKDNPETISLSSGTPLSFYWSTSPPQFCAGQRTSDIDAIVDVMRKSKDFIYIAVMDYLAALKFTYPRKFYSVIDDEIRASVYDRGVHVRLLMSNWSSTDVQQLYFLRSLKQFGSMPKIKGSISVKLFTVPPNYTIPYARVNHNKYMVTDASAFISTSNWSGDYFVSTGGVSLIVNQTEPNNQETSDSTVRQQLEDVFLRDWESKYSMDIQ